ncbi:PucR family transcriptional regulator [Rhodococcus gordoniae]|uniref:PucR family transcriptional regulator n=1 Tax=Rhodococcus gordoniae TaxID=223392 RepID=UPI0020CFA361|nr:PucR family transcriptional regulator [Rhodococcus gordoniae]UTT51000.1 PucR family transcriptional regulator [Rhodococcus gordoniae]
MYSSTEVIPYGRNPTLRRLLAEKDLELRLVAGSRERTDRVMQGIHLTEVLEVDKWLTEGWVMMTTGYLLQRDSEAQRRLVRTLDKIGAVGLGYCVEIFTKHVPAALLDEARALDFPLFVMPLHIKARDVSTRANRMILANDDTLFRQAQSTQDLFFENFDTGTRADWLPERQLVENLSAFLCLPVRFFAKDSVYLADADPVTRLLLTAPTHAPIKQRSGADDLLIVPARVGAIFTGWLVVTLPHDMSDGQVAMNTSLAVARLVALSVVSRNRPASSDRAVRQEVMSQLLRRGWHDTESDPLKRLQSSGTLGALHDLGFRSGEPIRGSVVERGGSVQPHAERAGGFDATVEELHGSGAPYVFLVEGNRMTVVTQMPLDDLVAVLGATDHGIAGIGGEGVGATDVPKSVAQATSALAMATAGEDGATPRFRYIVFDNVAMSAWMIHHHRVGAGPARARRQLAELRENQTVFETVVSYFGAGMDVGLTADRLFIHVNSVRYRLRKAEEILQASLQHPAVISDLYLALRVCGDL